MPLWFLFGSYNVGIIAFFDDLCVGDYSKALIAYLERLFTLGFYLSGERIELFSFCKPRATEANK